MAGDNNVQYQDGEASQKTGQDRQQEHVATPNTPPPPPVPSMDPGLINQARTPPPLHAAAPTPSSQDLFKIPPITALKLLSSGIEALVSVTGDIPPTPPPANPMFPHMSGMQREKADIVRSHSEKSLTRLREQAEAAEKQKAQEGGGRGSYFDSIQSPTLRPPIESQSSAASSSCSSSMQQPIDGVRLRDTSTPPSTMSSSAALKPYIIIGADSQPLNLQHSAITRKFFSKAPPPISVEEYLLRIHRFCPMSTAVYLAASYYIFRLAVEERAIPVTRRNCHRLLLAGLRVAMKALEDLSYPHKKIARVGGVSEAELARLEISFCFLTGFELVVGEEALRRHWEVLKSGEGFGGSAAAGAHMPQLDGVPNLRFESRRKKGQIGGPEGGGT
ncbi:hypothetical protein DL763_000530 [Monosporascus cannonballus]|nr:hypothetical protein DL763_000530 [Monosporascus cannonballus]